MCELFGVSSPEKIDIKDLLLEFFSHSIRHPDGWGMAFFDDNDVALEKQPLDSRKSQYLKSRMKAIGKADNMIAHIRLATKGSVEYENTHPFVKKDRFGRSWTLAFRKGKLEYIGTNHGNEFTDNASKIRHLYLDYAAL